MNDGGGVEIVDGAESDDTDEEDTTAPLSPQPLTNNSAAGNAPSQSMALTLWKGKSKDLAAKVKEKMKLKVRQAKARQPLKRRRDKDYYEKGRKAGEQHEIGILALPAGSSE